jgi:hypothetical protein
MKFNQLLFALCLAGWLLLAGHAPTAVHAATLTVTTTNDNGAGSLRAQIAAAAAGDTIVFAPGLSGQTITLTSGEILINKSLTLDGSALATPIAVSGNNASRVFNIGASGVVTLNGFTVRNGRVNGKGGGILNAGNLTLMEMTITNNETITSFGNDGGGIANSGSITILRSTITNNIAFDFSNGGGLYSDGTATIENSTFSGNQSGTGRSGGGIINNNPDNVLSMTIRQSTIVGNCSPTGSGGLHVSGQPTTTAVSHTIIAGNVRCSTTTADDQTNSFQSNGHNFIGAKIGSQTVQATDIHGTVASPANPLLGTLQNNGGRTQTYRPAFNSPVIDAGGACLSTIDQRGTVRGDYACDMGAVEVQFSDSGTISKSVSAGNTYTFGPTLAKVQVVNNGGCLTGLTVTRTNSNHPQAVSQPNLNLQTGVHWAVTGIGCSSGFTVVLTLPTPNFTPDANDKLCRYAASVWDCGLASQNSPTTATMVNGSSINVITRQGVNAFSDWAAGNNVGPTAVTNLHIQTSTPSPTLLIPLLATLLTLLSSTWLWLRRSA